MGLGDVPLGRDAVFKGEGYGLGSCPKRYLLLLVTKSCPALYDPMDCSPSGSSVHGISQQEYWSGLPFPSLGDLCHPGIESASPALAGRVFTTEPLGKPERYLLLSIKKELKFFLEKKSPIIQHLNYGSFYFCKSFQYLSTGQHIFLSCNHCVCAVYFLFFFTSHHITNISHVSKSPS